MTKYLKNPGAGWDNPGSTPIEDVRAAKKLIEGDSENVKNFKRAIDKWKKEVGDPGCAPHPTAIFERPNLTDDDLREIGDYFEKVFGGWRPKEVIRADGSPRAVPC